MNATKKREMILTWALMLSLLLSGCSAIQEAVQEWTFLQPIASFRGVAASVDGAIDTYRYMRGNEVVLMWFQDGGKPSWGLTLMKQSWQFPTSTWRYLTEGKAVNIPAGGDAAKIDALLRANGWKMVESDKLDPQFVAAVKAGFETFMTFMTVRALSWSSFIFIPAGELPEYPGEVRN